MSEMRIRTDIKINTRQSLTTSTGDHGEIRSIGHIGRLKHILDNDADYVPPDDMLAELRDDNRQLTSSMRETHDLCDEHGDIATASLLENWIDEAERRTWFLFEVTRNRG